jgi:hypothetical protein
LRDLVPVLGLAIKSAAQMDVARTLGRVYLGRDASEQVLRGRIARGVTERINAVLWFSDLRGSTAISEALSPVQSSRSSMIMRRLDRRHPRRRRQVLKRSATACWRCSRTRTWRLQTRRAALPSIVSGITWRSTPAAQPTGWR